MDDDERDRIVKKAREEAGIENRLRNAEDEIKEIRVMMTWVVRGIWGGAAYLATELVKFILQGGSIGK